MMFEIKPEDIYRKNNFFLHIVINILGTALWAMHRITDLSSKLAVGGVQ